MDEHVCPVNDCEYSTDSNRGLAIHASQKHDDLDHDFTNKTEYECPQCGDAFQDYASRRESKDSKRHFCSKECKDLFEAQDGLDTTCAECGVEIHVPPSQANKVGGYEQRNHFCDKECESLFKSREWVGENHPLSVEKETTTCEECGTEYSVKPSVLKQSIFCSVECQRENWKVEKEKYECVNCGENVKRKPYNANYENVVCSKECLSEYMSSIRRGEDNPQWKGGRFNYFGPNWPEQRQSTLEQDDYRCTECGLTRDEHYQQYGEDLHVHHKVPRRQIIDEEEPTVEQFELANSLDNLVTVCSTCHRTLESS